MANSCHTQPTQHTNHADHADLHAALISADAHVGVGCHCDPLLTTNVHADVLSCSGGLANVHHDHSIVGINIDPDYHVWFGRPA
jgi:hypothetical protein